MSATATVHDFTPGAFRKKLARHQMQTTPTPQPETETIFSDMADGILALDYALTFAKFTYDARQLVLSVAGLIGDADGELAIFDEAFAEHLKCSTRTVRRWRAEYMKLSRVFTFGFLEIIEGDYDPQEKRFLPTRYRFIGEAREYVERAVAEARQSSEYKRDRQAAIKKAAEACYTDLPEAPPIDRNHKPKRSTTIQIERDFINAKKNLAKGQRTLGDLPERARTVFLAGTQGEELRALLLQMQQEIAGLLQDFPQTVDNVEVDHTPDILSGIPPCSEYESAHTSQEQTAYVGGDENPEFTVRPSSSYTRTQDLEAAAVFDRLDERLRAPRAPSPHVRSVTLEIVAEPEIVFDDAAAAPLEPDFTGAPTWTDEPVDAIRADTETEESFTPPAELTYEPDDHEPDSDERREAMAIRAIDHYGVEFDDEGNITRIPSGTPDFVVDDLLEDCAMRF